MSRFTHSSLGAVPHSVNPAWQVSAQTPLLQASPAAQPVPQAAVSEQYRLSVSRFTHSSLGAVPHSVSPAWQVSAQTPALQISPAAQPVPQTEVSEQYRLSVSRLTHSSLGVAPHSVSPVWQVSAQTPEPSQISPGSQPVPQMPVASEQKRLSVSRFTHSSSGAVPHSVSPA